MGNFAIIENKSFDTPSKTFYTIKEYIGGYWQGKRLYITLEGIYTAKQAAQAEIEKLEKGAK